MKTIFSILSLALATTAFGQECTDIDDGQDHELLSRYAGSCLVGYEAKEFSDFVLPLAAMTRDDASQLVPGESLTLEGKTTRLVYVAPEGRSTLEVLRNYEESLVGAAYEVVFECAGAACSPAAQLGTHHLWAIDKRLDNTRMTPYAITGNSDEQRYFAAKSSGPQGDTYVSVYVAENDFSGYPEAYGRAVALIDIIEMEAMDTGMVDAAAMAKSLDTDGKVSIYGIHFDTGEATVKPESEPTLQQMAGLLQSRPDLEVYVVGHTDNVGSLDSNMDLSRRRAEAVVAALSDSHGIAADRLVARGVGPLAPVSTNTSDDGRALNRRVELVVR